MIKGSKQTEEAKAKIRAKHLGRTHTEATRLKISQANKGRKMPPEAIAQAVKTRSENRQKYDEQRSFFYTPGEGYQQYRSDAEIGTGRGVDRTEAA